MTKIVPDIKLPSEITSYDLLKTFAVVIMIVDHMGAYFFPDDLWWRAVGRIGFPVWFFLVGYARGRDLPAKLLTAAGILFAGNLIAGMAIFPVSALVTIGLIRILIDKVMAFSLKSKWHLWGGSIALFLLVPPSYMFTEYGTQALITAIFGYLVRHRKEVNDDQLIIHYMIFALGTFIAVQAAVFDFTMAQFLFMAIGTGVVRASLYYFQAITFPKLTTILPRVTVWFTQFCGRKTLEIYVVHLLLFKALAVWWGLDGYGLFDPRLVDIDSATGATAPLVDQ